MYTPETITVYQAHPVPVALAAARAGRFVPPFQPDRMSWLKPSFRWMMYRSQWATASGQERILAVEITREGFEWALAHSCLAQYDHNFYPDRDDWCAKLKSSPVRFQWEPERSLRMAPLPYRALQVGLGVEVIDKFVGEWTVGIEDITHAARRIGDLVRRGDEHRAGMMLPDERPYPLPGSLAAALHISI
ncbi:DUF4291 domain-containing protein [Actinoplanes sp. N902-109]|uniref:DUF4291 domain-containing protein n=1 Tax=Actinoplanes sp. (strain N902-109) TaxID=649831 RepID=UPI00032963EE|nr:DUF4291 domain-containing protein [Actinoplanes sp. N902-109]AGL21360.1 hypothetical protein L083_7850 [Actinoplanes sp. N902-109]